MKLKHNKCLLVVPASIILEAIKGKGLIFRVRQKVGTFLILTHGKEYLVL